MKVAGLEQTQGVGAGFGGDNLVSVAFENGVDQGHDGWFVLDEQQGREGGLGFGFSSVLHS
jgi:hypothetical protein